MRLTSTTSPYLLPNASKPQFQGNCISSANQPEQAQSASLMDLPPEILERIAKNIHKNPDPYLETKDIAALGATNKTFRAITQVKQLNDFTHQLWVLAPNQRECLPLALLKPQNRQALVDKALNTSNTLEEFDQAITIKWLAKGLEYLTPQQRTDLIQAMLKLKNEESKARALKWLAKGLEYLTPKQRTDLVQATLQLERQESKGTAIKWLGTGLEYLTPEQRTDLVQATLALTDERDKASAIEGLASKLKYLTPGQRTNLVQATLQLERQESKAYAIARLAKQLEHLTPEERTALLQATHQVHELFQPLTRGALANQSEYLRPEEQVQLNQALTQDKANIQAHITQMFQLMPHLPDEEDIATTIAELSSNFSPYLTVVQRANLVQATLQFEDEGAKGTAIEGLTRKLENLTPEQQTELIQATLQLENEDIRARAIPILATKLECLTPEQRTGLFEAAHQITQPFEKSLATAELAKKLDCLTPKQRTDLVESTFQLEEANRGRVITGLTKGLKSAIPV